MTALDPTLFAVIFVAGIGVVLWTVLFVGDRLIAISLNRSAGSQATSGQSRCFRDLKPLEEPRQSQFSLRHGKGPSDNRGIGWRSRLRDVTPPPYKRPVANISELRNLAVARAAQANLIQQNTTVFNKGNKEMNDENITITDADHAQLSSVIAFTGKVPWRTKFELRLLENALKRAQIVATHDLPPDVITMNSRAELRDLESDERMVLTLVLRVGAKMSDGMISVLAPLGAAMLGNRVGDEIEWHVPHGLRRLKVINLRFQPEASLKKAA
jgi:regulator of nucleoside diphosphate kinase